MLLWACDREATQDTLITKNPILEPIFKEAKTKQKNVLMFFHFEGCGACVKMEKEVLADTAVRKYINDNFIFRSVDIKKGDGVEINKLYKLQFFPYVIISDHNGHILGRKGWIRDVKSFINFCEVSTHPETSLYALKQQYRQGQRGVDFLWHYCNAMYDANERDSLAINEYLSALDQKTLKTKANIGFIYANAIMNSQPNIDLESSAFELLYNNKDLFYQYFDSIQVDGRIVFIADTYFNRALKTKDCERMHKCLGILKAYVSNTLYRVNDVNHAFKNALYYRQNQYLIDEIMYSLCANKEGDYKQLMDTFWIEHANNPEILNLLAWNFFLFETDTNKLLDAEKCIKKAIALDNQYAYKDTYAWLLFKQGKYKAAKQQAQQAIALAKQNKQGFAETAKLLDSIAKIDKL